jgi:hypothetical protein
LLTRKHVKFQLIFQALGITGLNSGSTFASAAAAAGAKSSSSVTNAPYAPPDTDFNSSLDSSRMLGEEDLFDIEAAGQRITKPCGVKNFWSGGDPLRFREE